MSLLRWLREFFPRHGDDVDEAFEARLTRRRRSANICLASRGATQRERNNAYTYLCEIESFYR